MTETIHHIEEFLFLSLDEATATALSLGLEVKTISATAKAMNRHRLPQGLIIFRVDESDTVEEVIYHSDTLRKA